MSTSGALPAPLAELVEELGPMERSLRAETLVEYADQFTEVPPAVAARPFAERNRAPRCESEAYVFATDRPDGTLQRVLADPSLYNNLNESAASAARVLARAEKIARDLEVFSDKVARRPEVLGVGGAVRPSAGLKESPLAPTPQPPPPTVGPIAAPIPPVPGGVTSFKPGAWEDLLGPPIDPKR